MSQGIQLESVSMGKGFVEWRVVYPPLKKKKRVLRPSYDEIDEACRELKRHCRRDELDPDTARLVDQYCPNGDWATGGA